MKAGYLTGLIATGLACAWSGTAMADEQWTSDGKIVTYEAEEGDLAIFSFDGTKIYVEGLAGVYEGRGSYSGIWMLDKTPMITDETGEEIAAQGCGFSMLRPGKDAGDSGETSEYWGRVEVTFIDADFPGIWIGYFGDCFDTPMDTMVARPVLAESQPTTGE